MELTSNPFFSIIIPAYNSEKFISPTIQSVIDQTFQNWELVVVDDGSEDRTVKIVEAFSQNDERIKLLSTPKNTRRAGIAREVGIEASIGEYVTFLDSDDHYYNKKLEIHYEHISKDQSIDIISTAWDIVDSKGELLISHTMPWFQKVYSSFLSIKNVCLLTNPICTSTVVIKKSIISKYDFSLYTTKAAEDWLMWNDLFHGHSPKYYYEDTPLTRYRIRRRSLSNRKELNINYYGIVIFSILLSTYRINFFQWFVATSVRLIRNVITQKSIRV